LINAINATGAAVCSTQRWYRPLIERCNGVSGFSDFSDFGSFGSGVVNKPWSSGFKHLVGPSELIELLY